MYPRYPLQPFAVVALFLTALRWLESARDWHQQTTSLHVRNRARPTIMREQDIARLLANLGRMEWTGSFDFTLRYINDAICLRSKLRRDKR